MFNTTGDYTTIQIQNSDGLLCCERRQLTLTRRNRTDAQSCDTDTHDIAYAVAVTICKQTKNTYHSRCHTMSD